MTTSARPSPPTDADWRAVVALLRRSAEVGLFCHVHPDGDTLGSALAVGLALRAAGRRAYVSVGEEPLGVPGSLAFLPGQDLLVPPAEVPDRPGLVVVFDAASADRLGLLVGKAAAAEALVVVDHHASNTRFGTHHLVDVAAPATAVVVEELLRRLGARLTRDVATCLYTGLASDTGSFRSPGITASTHELAGRLLRAGIRHDQISREIWDTTALGSLKVLARALEGSRLETAAAGAGLVWTVVSRADRAEFGVAMDEIEGVIDVVRKTAEAEVAMVFKEDTDGSFRVSARSKGRVDVAAMCGAFGGGGHRFAAGFTATGEPAAVVAEVLRRLDGATGQLDVAPDVAPGPDFTPDLAPGSDFTPEPDGVSRSDAAPAPANRALGS